MYERMPISGSPELFFQHLRSVHRKTLGDSDQLIPMSTEAVRGSLPEDFSNRRRMPISNRILLSLPEGEFELLRPLLTFQVLAPDATLYEPGSNLEFLYLPNHGLVSTVVSTRDGKSVVVGAVGNEGLVGSPAIVGLDKGPHRAVVQIEGAGLRVPTEKFQSVLESSPQLRHLVSLHAMIQGMESAQSAACNRLHSVEQRLARWLLIMQDRVDQASLHITHVSLASMLGTDRPSVSQAAGGLHKKGAIEYARGKVRIIDRALLEETTCECYRVMQPFNNFLRLQFTKQAGEQPPDWASRSSYL